MRPASSIVAVVVLRPEGLGVVLLKLPLGAIGQ
jgi:hypothetical protein